MSSDHSDKEPVIVQKPNPLDLLSALKQKKEKPPKTEKPPKPEKPPKKEKPQKQEKPPKKEEILDTEKLKANYVPDLGKNLLNNIDPLKDIKERIAHFPVSSDNVNIPQLPDYMFNYAAKFKEKYLNYPTATDNVKYDIFINNFPNDRNGIKLFKQILNGDIDAMHLLNLYLITSFGKLTDQNKKDEFRKNIGYKITNGGRNANADIKKTLEKIENDLSDQLKYKKLSIEEQKQLIRDKFQTKYAEDLAKRGVILANLRSDIDKRLEIGKNELNLIHSDVIDELESIIDELKNKKPDDFEWVVDEDKGYRDIGKTIEKYPEVFKGIAKYDKENDLVLIEPFNKKLFNNDEIVEPMYDKLLINVNDFIQNHRTDYRNLKKQRNEVNTFFGNMKRSEIDLEGNTQEELNENIEKYNNEIGTIDSDLLAHLKRFYDEHATLDLPPMTRIDARSGYLYPSVSRIALEDTISDLDNLTSPTTDIEEAKKLIAKLKDDPTNNDIFSQIQMIINNTSEEGKKYLENIFMLNFDKFFTKQIDTTLKTKSSLPQQYVSMFNDDWNKMLNDNPYLKNVYSMLDQLNKDKATILKEQLAHNFYEKYKYLKLVNPTIINSQNWLNINSYLKDIINSKNEKNIYKKIKALSTLNNIDKDNSIYKHKDENIKKTQLSKLSFKYAKLLDSYQNSPQKNITNNISKYLYNEQDEQQEQEQQSPKLSISHK